MCANCFPSNPPYFGARQFIARRSIARSIEHNFTIFIDFLFFLSKISFLWMICSNLFVFTNSFLFFLSEYICFVSFVSVLLPQLSISHWFSLPPLFLPLFYLFSDDKFFTVLNIITFRHNLMVSPCRSIVRTKLLDKFSRSPARFNLFI